MESKNSCIILKFLSENMIKYARESGIDSSKIDTLVEHHKLFFQTLTDSPEKKMSVKPNVPKPSPIQNQKTLEDFIKQKNEQVYTMTTHDYIQFLKKEIKFMKQTVTFRRCNDTILQYYLTPYEQRLLMFHTFYNTSVTEKDIDQCTKMIQTDCKTFFKKIPFLDSIWPNFMNYSLALINIVKWLGLHIKYMKNVVYCPNFKNFFIIHKREGSKYYWKLDNELEFFTNTLQTFLIETIISLYRKVYKCIFKNNYYVEDMNGYGDIIEFEATQLMVNLIYISSWPHFYSKVKELMIKYNTKELKKEYVNITPIVTTQNYKNHRPDVTVARLYNKLADSVLNNSLKPKIENYLKKF